MKKIYLVFVCIIAHLNSISAQINDSIIIYAELDSITDELIVKQEFKIYNHSQKTLKETRLHSWANAYSGRITTLNKTKLEDRKGHLHFSEKHQRGGINDLKFYDEHSNLIAYETSEREFIKMNLKNPNIFGLYFVIQMIWILGFWEMSYVRNYGVPNILS